MSFYIIITSILLIIAYKHKNILTIISLKFNSLISYINIVYGKRLKVLTLIFILLYIIFYLISIISASVDLFHLFTSNNLMFSLFEEKFYLGTGSSNSIYSEKLHLISHENYVKSNPDIDKLDSEALKSNEPQSDLLKRRGLPKLELPKLELSSNRFPSPITKEELQKNLLENTKNNLKELKIKEKYFADIVEKINKGTEEFYPDEAKNLFGKDYKEAVAELIKSNKEILKGLSDNKETSNLFNSIKDTKISSKELGSYNQDLHKLFKERLDKIILTMNQFKSKK